MKKHNIIRLESIFMTLLFLTLSLTCCKTSKYVPVVGVEDFSNDTANQMDSTNQTEKVYLQVEEPPQYKGGMTALLKFITENTVYPKEAAEAGIQGRVIVRFVIDPEGRVVNPEILDSVHELLDAEAIRVVSSMPKWKPGRHEGRLVYVYYTIPMLFAPAPKAKE